MRNCLIMGFGRSGTSLMTGILSEAGYFAGENLYPARESNPKGFFENEVINGINEKILKKYDYQRLHKEIPRFHQRFSPYAPGEGHRWLSYISPDCRLTECEADIREAIAKALSVKGYAYKDPRFNYTLKFWEEAITDDTLMICMFRQPEITVGSIIRECQVAGYLSEFYIEAELAYQLWFNSYTHLLNNLSSISSDRILFVHYEQLLTGSVLPLLSRKLDVDLDSAFCDRELNRSSPAGIRPDAVDRLYRTLCDFAAWPVT